MAAAVAVVTLTEEQDGKHETLAFPGEASGRGRSFRLNVLTRGMHGRGRKAEETNDGGLELHVSSFDGVEYWSSLVL